MTNFELAKKIVLAFCKANKLTINMPNINYFVGEFERLLNELMEFQGD